MIFEQCKYYIERGAVVCYYVRNNPECNNF